MKKRHIFFLFKIKYKNKIKKLKIQCLNIFILQQAIIYLVNYQANNYSHHCGVGAHLRRGKRQEGKKRKKSQETERDRVTEGENRNLPLATDALIGNEEQNEKQKKETGSGLQPIYPGPFGRLLRPSWIIRRAYSKPLPLPPVFI